jgi:putative holliday junction resolvase
VIAAEQKCREDGEGGRRPARPAEDAEVFCRTLPRGARLIGIDVGSKTLGLALSDVTRTIASALTTLQRGKFQRDVERLAALIEEHGVGGLVVGLPANLDGSEGPRAQATRAFVRNLSKRLTLPILFWDERFTTTAAERLLIEAETSRRRRAAVIDKVAATLILQTALDRMNQKAKAHPREDRPREDGPREDGPRKDGPRKDGR